MTKFEITLAHADLGEAKTFVEIVAIDSFEQEYAAMVHAAQKNVASRHVDYESFGSDSAYATRLSELGAEFVPAAAALVTVEPLQRFAVDGEYSTNSDRWDGYVMARSAAEADFQARWTMAKNEGGDPDDHDGFQEMMEDITISNCGLEPVSLAESLSYLRTMSGLVIPGDEDFGPESDQSDSEALYAMVRKARDMLAGKAA
jgi:hypothetical protein